MSKIKIIRQSDRAFGFTMAALILFVSVVIWWLIDVFSIIAIFIAIIFFSIALILPKVLFPFNRLWNALLARFGLFNNYFILGLFFFLILTPVGLIFRIFGRYSLERGFKSELPTYYSPVYRQTNKETLTDLF